MAFKLSTSQINIEQFKTINKLTVTFFHNLLPNNFQICPVKRQYFAAFSSISYYWFHFRFFTRLVFNLCQYFFDLVNRVPFRKQHDKVLIQAYSISFCPFSKFAVQRFWNSQWKFSAIPFCLQRFRQWNVNVFL
ncbi:hypothetical protein RW64_04360 [Geobacter sulfurreducens]|nr:hypothetical protein RW64_04360 [Geobacter sulfurreducens]